MKTRPERPVYPLQSISLAMQEEGSGLGWLESGWSSGRDNRDLSTSHTNSIHSSFCSCSSMCLCSFFFLFKIYTVWILLYSVPSPSLLVLTQDLWGSSLNIVCKNVPKHLSFHFVVSTSFLRISVVAKTPNILLSVILFSVDPCASRDVNKGELTQFWAILHPATPQLLWEVGSKWVGWKRTDDCFVLVCCAISCFQIFHSLRKSFKNY